ncbi:MAG TPA: endonuclease/exonuclease/phosphatase family protein [Micromonosporaceae bacterium]|nr:endonuclease/exonuclease/phosphatase family protein [Micromonosporaceae bacterium]
MTVLCWALAAPGLAWAAVRLGGVEVGPLVQLLAFTPYAAAWSPVPAGLALGLRRWWPAAAAGLASAALLTCVLPGWVGDGGGAGRDVGGGPVVRVLSVNLLEVGGSPEAVLALVRDRRVDVLAVQELSPETLAALDRLGLRSLLAHRSAGPAYGSAGSGVFSRFPLASAGVRRNPSGMRQAYATVLVAGASPVLVESVHSCSPYALRQVRCWRADLAAQPAATPDGQVRLLTGDFNATLDHAAMRRILGTGYRDAAAAVGQGLAGTWGPYDGDPIPPVTIDHVLVDRRVGVRSVSVHGIPGSDHRAVLAELSLPPA